MKKTISVLLLLVMLISASVASADEAPILISAKVPALNDVTPDDWAYEEITSMASLGLASLDENGNFNPSSPLSIAELLSLPEWTKSYTDSAIKETYGENPASYKTVTRAEMASVIVKAINAQSEYAASSFSDVTDDMWYAKDAECAKTIGIIKGYEDGTFRGDNAVSKREACVIIYRLKAFLDVISAK